MAERCLDLPGGEMVYDMVRCKGRVLQRTGGSSRIGGRKEEGDEEDELADGGEEAYGRVYERHEATGRTLGPNRFMVMFEKALARVLQSRKCGPKTRREG